MSGSGLLDARIDIAPASLSNILSRLSRQVYITQEVTDTTGVYVSKHQGAGDVQVCVQPLLPFWIFYFSITSHSDFSQRGVSTYEWNSGLIMSMGLRTHL